MKVGIVIPAYNEERRIRNTLREYLSYFEMERKKGFDYKILVSINATTDSTPEIVNSFAVKNKRLSSINLTKGGKGNAIIEGFKELLKENVDIIGFVDADMATKPEDFHKLIKSMGTYDGVIASRYLKGAIVKPKPSLNRIVASRIFNSSVRAILILPYKDTQCGAKVFRKEAIKKVLPKLSLSKWAFDVDLIYHLKKDGFSLLELPTVWADKEYSKINFVKAGPMMLLGVIRLRIINSPFGGMISIYDSVLNYSRKLVGKLI